MIDPALQLPSALARQARFVRLGPTGVPALLAHPDWSSRVPCVIWMHGRTVTKELDNGRYLRLIRAGIAACAIDLPGHGERFEARAHEPAATPGVIASAVAELDGVVNALAHPGLGPFFDSERLGLGGMSAGGMVTLRRLCDPHTFRCAAVEGTGGDLAMLYGDLARPGAVAHDLATIATIDPMPRLAGWRPVPLLAMHSESDEIVPVACIRSFVTALRAHCGAALVRAPVELRTWPATGAPHEHNGFGRVANEAKTALVEFFVRHLLG
ncbi:MAG: alpha/beta hydrolase family protein [Phycisphaerales bacterium]